MMTAPVPICVGPRATYVSPHFLVSKEALAYLRPTSAGTTAAGQPDFAAWVKQFSWESHIGGDMAKLSAFLESKGATSVGAIGFCWGVWAFCKANSAGVGNLKCGVGCHPSTQLEGLMGGNEVAMFEAMTMPVLSMPAGNDREELKEGGPLHALVASKGGETEAFPDMSHGWVSRGDVGDAAVKRGVEAAMTRAIAYFAKYI